MPSRSPRIHLDGIRKSIPPGYVLGRVDAGTGDVQLIKLADLATRLVATGQVGNPAPPQKIYAPLVNGDPPGDDLVGYPDGQVKGPTLMSLPNGACVMVQIG